MNAQEFNALLADPNTICVDMRNHYESEIGHFKGAVTPDVDTFRESLPIIEEDLAEHKSDKNLLMYCTGGIRCEKASAYFKHKGFENVFQLEGGIIEYTRQVKAEGLENQFVGKNFVFDERRGERISEDIISQCHQCGALATPMLTAPTRLVTCCLFSVKHVKRKWKPPVLRIVTRSFNCPLKSKKRCARVPTIATKYSRKDDRRS